MMIKAEWQWDLGHKPGHQGRMESERGEGHESGEEEPGTSLHHEEEEKGPAGGPLALQKLWGQRCGVKNSH